MKNKKWDFAKSALITFLAASKILNWIDAGFEMIQSDAEVAWFPLFARLIVRDLPIALAVIGFVFIHRSKGRLWIKLIIGYVATIAILFLYLFIAPLIFNMSIITPLFDLFVYYSVSYVAINIFLVGKDIFKRRTKGDEASLADGGK